MLGAALETPECTEERDMKQATRKSGLPRAVPERMLLRRARRGDREAFFELVGRHRSRIYSLTLAALQSREDAERVLLDTFASAWEAVSQLPPGEAFSSTLVKLNGRRIMRCLRSREAIDAVPRLAPRIGTIGRLPGARAGSSEGKAPASSCRRWAVAAANLPAVHRAQLVLRDLGRLSYDDIAAASGTQGTAVKRNIHDARVRMVRAIDFGFQPNRSKPRAGAFGREAPQLIRFAEKSRSRL